MAGYVFAIGGDTDNPELVIKECVEKGIYSTYIRTTAAIPFEGTLADYLSMKPGDNIYFFSKRKYYGVGELVQVGPDCKYCNYPTSGMPKIEEYDSIRNQLLVDYGPDSAKYRWICTFKGSPYFFERGIDTDEILTYKPNTFRILRAFWKVSFIKLGDEENASLKEIFLLRHQEEINNQTGIISTQPTYHTALRLKVDARYALSTQYVLANCSNGSYLKHEMALEAATIEALVNEQIPELGHWDYISHQVIASPFKPIDYMDKIDIFAYRYLHGTKIPCKYLVAELKRGTADADTVDQVMKYVDWVCQEYTYGDYDAVEACIIAFDFDDDIADHIKQNAKRRYMQGSHPIKNKEWRALKLISYKYHNGKVVYTDETPEI